MTERPVVVSAHALDTGAGDGVVGDAAVFGELDCRAVCVATSVLVPEPLPLDVVSRQLERAARLGALGAVRIGFVHGAPQVETLAHFVRRCAPEASVVAPVLRSGTDPLIDADTLDAIARYLYPVARVVVARAADLAVLTGRDADDPAALRDAAKRIQDRGARAVVVSGASLHGRVLDVVADGDDVLLLDTAKIHAPHVAGLAGSFAAALAAHLARGLSVRDAAASAQRYVGFRILRGR